MLTEHPFYRALQDNILKKKNCVCLGLDPDPVLMPAMFPKTIKGIEEFLLVVIEASKDLVVAYKPNVAFFEGLGLEGLAILPKLRAAIPSDIPYILDAKRGDIGNTSGMQAKFIFEHLGADAITLHPYMGYDSLAPFFNYKDKYSFVLALTSNPGAVDFEKQTMAGAPFYQHVLKACKSWNESHGNIGVVVGATQHEMVDLRRIDPSMLFLIPGVGHQGGTYSEALNQGQNQDGMALINMGRSLLYGDSSSRFSDHLRNQVLSFRSVQSLS